MNSFETVTADAHQAVAGDWLGADGAPWLAPRVDNGIHTRWLRTRAGMIQLDPAPEHRIRIHAGGKPVRGMCSETPFVYTHGDMDMMPAGHTESWREDDDNTSLYLSLAPWLLQRTAEELGIDPQAAGVELRYQFRDSQIEHIALALDAERRSGDLNGNLYAESLGTALAVHLLRRYPQAAAHGGGLRSAKLRQLREFIDGHLDQPLSLAQLAVVAGVSSSHLKTLFRRSTGTPVHQYVMRRRVERARELLQHSDLPLSQIALDAGFSHQSHMARNMQRLLGVAPAALRRARGR